MEEQTSAAVMNYLRSSNINVFDFIRNAHEFEKKRDVIISKTLISGTDDRLKDETTTVVAEVLKLKDVLGCGEHSEAVLLAALSKLQRMVISVKVLQSTRVGVSVNRLRNHASKHVSQISRKLVKKWKGVVDSWLQDNSNKNNKAESIQNPPQIEKPRHLIIRIKLKKDDSKEVSKPVLDVSVSKKVENICSSVKTLNETGIGRLVDVPDSKHGGRKIENLKKQILIDYECDIFDESVKAKGIGRSVRAVDEKRGSKESGLMVDSGNMKKRKLDDGVEEKLNTLWMKKYYVEEKKVGIKRLTYDEEIRLRSSTQIKPPHKRQMRRRW